MISRKLPAWEKEKRADLRERYGGMLGLAQIQRELGTKDQRIAERWLQELPYIRVGKRKKWAIEDIARKLYIERVEPT